VPVGGGAETAAFNLAQELRHDGFTVDIGYGGNLSRRMKRANKLRARLAVILGEDEIRAGTVTVRDLDTGEHVWQVAFGKGPANHPLLKHLNLPPLGSAFTDVSHEGGLLITKTLLIAYLAQKDEIDPDAHGSILVAHNKMTGELIGEIMVDQRLHGPPMTYMHEGRQYIAVAGGGRDKDDELIVFALPEQ